MLLCLSLKSVLFPECFPIVQASPFTQGHSSFLTVWRPTIKQGAKTQRGDPDPYLCTIWGGHLPSLALIFFFKLRSEKFSGSTVFSSSHPLAAGVVNFAWKVIDLGKKKKKKILAAVMLEVSVSITDTKTTEKDGWRGASPAQLLGVRGNGNRPRVSWSRSVMANRSALGNTSFLFSSLQCQTCHYPRQTKCHPRGTALPV